MTVNQVKEMAKELFLERSGILIYDGRMFTPEANIKALNEVRLILIYRFPNSANIEKVISSISEVT